jgi:hypothetical protein
MASILTWSPEANSIGYYLHTPSAACREMKNPRFERRRRLSRQYHRNQRRGRFEQGILAWHDYGDLDPAGLSWWDDVQFILGGRRIAVVWQHPRHVYQGMIEDAAMQAAHHLYEEVGGCAFERAERIYRKVGRSRKRVTGYTLGHRPGEQEWFDALRAEEARLSREAEFSVRPSIRVTMLAWCRFVDVVAPVEIRSVVELRVLADLVRRILKGETTLEREFPGYVYGKAQWLAEGLAERPPGLFSHRILGEGTHGTGDVGSETVRSHEAGLELSAESPDPSADPKPRHPRHP